MCAEGLAVRNAAPRRDSDQNHRLRSEGGELVHRLSDELHDARVIAASQNPRAYEYTSTYCTVVLSVREIHSSSCIYW